MLQYQKGPEPKELKLLRSTPDANYNQSKGKSLSDALRAALIRDQGSLCAYCQQSISDDWSQVEHWLTQSEHPDHQWIWSNMLGVCKGKANIEGKLKNTAIKAEKTNRYFFILLKTPEAIRVTMCDTIHKAVCGQTMNALSAIF